MRYIPTDLAKFHFNSWFPHITSSQGSLIQAVSSFGNPFRNGNSLDSLHSKLPIWHHRETQQLSSTQICRMVWGLWSQALSQPSHSNFSRGESDSSLCAPQTPEDPGQVSIRFSHHTVSIVAPGKGLALHTVQEAHCLRSEMMTHCQTNYIWWVILLKAPLTCLGRWWRARLCPLWGVKEKHSLPSVQFSFKKASVWKLFFEFLLFSLS